MAQELFGGGPPEGFKDVPVPTVRDGKPMLDFVRMDLKKMPPRVTRDYHPTCMYVVCTRCKTIGNLMFPRGFDYKTGDAIMDGKIVRGMCLTCRGVMEMRPLTPRELNDNQLALLRRHYEILKDHAIQHGLTDPTDAAFLEAFEKKYGVNGDPERMALEQAPPPEAPDGKPRIVVP